MSLHGPATVARPVWPVLLAAAIGCAILIGLGNWQMQRLAWKDGLLTKIEARVAAAPVDLAAAERQWRETGEVEYLRVSASGRFQGRDNFYFSVGPAGPGYHVYTPLVTRDGKVLLVNRGYIVDNMLPSAGQNFTRPAGDVTVTGLARASEEARLFAGSPPQPGRQGPWLSRDHAGMAARTGLPGLSPETLVPFFLDRDAGASDENPLGGTTRLDIANRHLEYALTWYGLAATLVVVAAVFVRARRRRP